MRKSIFDIVSENISIESEADRLITMATEEYVLQVNSYHDYTLFNYVDSYCFKDWLNRGHFIHVDDFLDTLGFDELKEDAKYSVDSLLTLIEVIYNFWTLSNQNLFNGEKGHQLRWHGNYYHLKDVMDDILQQYNHVAHTDNEQQCVLIIENKAEVTAAAEIMPTSPLAFDVIKYNHRSLSGEVELKKKILLSLATEIEPNRKILHKINPTLEDNIFFMLNNLNIRHNNRSKKDKSYKEYVAKMKKQRLEKWYDDLYQMLLLAFLQLDDIERTNRVKELKANITGGKENGKA